MNRKEVENADLDKLADLGALSEAGSPLDHTVKIEFLHRQTRLQERQTLAAEGAARAAEQQAAAAKEAADATTKYMRYTFWVAVFTGLVAAIAAIDLLLQ